MENSSPKGAEEVAGKSGPPETDTSEPDSLRQEQVVGAGAVLPASEAGRGEDKYPQIPEPTREPEADDVFATGSATPGGLPDALHAGPPHQAPTFAAPVDNETFLRGVAFDVVDKQYRLYSWHDTKAQALITTNSILFAAIGFLFKESLRDTLAMTLLALGAICLGSSLLICLLQVIPRLSSGKSGSEPNTRSLRGIRLFPRWEEYQKAFMETTTTSILKDTLRQIYGMANNNLRSARIVKRGVTLTILGILAILGALFTTALASRGYQAFGVRQTQFPDSSRAPVASPERTLERPTREPLPTPGTLPSTRNFDTIPIVPPAGSTSPKKKPLTGILPS